MLATEEAYRYKSTALEILHEEAMKTFKTERNTQSDFVEAFSRRNQN